MKLVVTIEEDSCYRNRYVRTVEISLPENSFEHELQQPAQICWHLHYIRLIGFDQQSAWGQLVASHNCDPEVVVCLDW